MAARGSGPGFGSLFSFAGLLNSSSPSYEAVMNQQEPALCSISDLIWVDPILIMLMALAWIKSPAERR
jgi:hypothetical protein